MQYTGKGRAQIISPDHEGGLAKIDLTVAFDRVDRKASSDVKADTHVAIAEKFQPLCPA